MLDFSLPMLESLLLTFKREGYVISRLDSYWRQKQALDQCEKLVLLRHDVDRFPKTALSVAEVETKLGVQSTFFFRVKSGVFDEAIIRQIGTLGHEIGYHYETMADAGGDWGRATDLFGENLAKLRAIAPVVSAAMHSRPFSKFDNRALWDHVSLESHGLLGEAYRSIDHHRFAYLADSGRNWGGDRTVVWDFVDGQSIPRIDGTRQLCELIGQGKFPRVQLLVHPNRWRTSLAGWCSEYVSDTILNSIKRAIGLTRSKCDESRVG